MRKVFVQLFLHAHMPASLQNCTKSRNMNTSANYDPCTETQLPHSTLSASSVK